MKKNNNINSKMNNKKFKIKVKLINNSLKIKKAKRISNKKLIKIQKKQFCYNIWKKPSLIQQETQHSQACIQSDNAQDVLNAHTSLTKETDRKIFSCIYERS